MRLSVAPPECLRDQLRLRVDGKVCAAVGLTLEGTCPGAAVGDLVELLPRGRAPLPAEVVGLRDGRVVLVPLGDPRGLAIGDRLSHLRTSATVACSEGLLGRVIDAMGHPIDGKGPIPGPIKHRQLYASPPSPLERSRIDTCMPTGVRAIDGVLSLGRGQRIGIMAGAGVGKSRLLGMLVNGAQSDINVVALIGERGREVVDFVEEVLPAAARRRTVVVVATSADSPLQRMRGAFLATAVAEHFCGESKHVLLVMDSLTRFAMAQRELGLSAGEPPATRGYTPSVFARLPQLLERAGSFRNAGSITGIYTVLVEGDDMNDPIGDAVRSILDGHIVLSRNLASRGHYPAIDVLGSISRVADAVVQPAHRKLMINFRRLLADLAEAQELVSIGAYVQGASPGVDRALGLRAEIEGFLRQASDERAPWPMTVKHLQQLVPG
jgi:flagellum-specific ATP synthase